MPPEVKRERGEHKCSCREVESVVRLRVPLLPARIRLCVFLPCKVYSRAARGEVPTTSFVKDIYKHVILWVDWQGRLTTIIMIIVALGGAAIR
jgi:hypothetical protein